MSRPNLSDICGLKVKMLVLEFGSKMLNLILSTRGETINSCLYSSKIRMPESLPKQDLYPLSQTRLLWNQYPLLAELVS